MTEEKTIKVMCTKGWSCGFYHNFEEAKKNNFLFCTLCGCFLRGAYPPNFLYTEKIMPRRLSAVPGPIPGGALGGDTMSNTTNTSGNIKVVLGSGEPGTPNEWNVGTVVYVDEATAQYVMRKMGKREIDKEVLAEAAKWIKEMDEILREVEEMEIEEELEDFLQLLPEEVC